MLDLLVWIVLLSVMDWNSTAQQGRTFRPLSVPAVSHFTEGLKLFSLKCLAHNVSLKSVGRKKNWCFLWTQIKTVTQNHAAIYFVQWWTKFTPVFQPKNIIHTFKTQFLKLFKWCIGWNRKAQKHNIRNKTEQS